jgi:hypothetical protein
LAFLAKNGPSKAKVIAEGLQVEGKEINSLLYGPLKSQVNCDPQYRWSLADASGPTRQPRPPVNGGLPGTERLKEALESDDARSLVGRCRRPSNRLALKVGLPVLVAQKTGQKGTFSKVEPILLWTLDKNDPAASVNGQGDLPSLNLAAIRSLTTKDQALEEILLLTRFCRRACSRPNKTL